MSEPMVVVRDRPSKQAIRMALTVEKVWTPEGVRDATDDDRARMVAMLGATIEEIDEALIGFSLPPP